MNMITFETEIPEMPACYCLPLGPLGDAAESAWRTLMQIRLVAAWLKDGQKADLALAEQSLANADHLLTRTLGKLVDASYWAESAACEVCFVSVHGGGDCGSEGCTCPS